MNREILRLAIPNIISNISVPLLSTVDTLLMGHQSKLHLGAIGLGSMIFNFIYWNFGFLRMGTTGLTAQAFGRDNKVEISNNLFRPVLISIVITILLILFLEPIYDLISYFLFVQPQHDDLVFEYFGIRMWAAPATLILYGLFGWFFGMQNAIYPLILTVFINLVNIIVSAYFVQQLEWGISGVAWGTVIAQFSGLGLAVLLLLNKYKEYITSVSSKALFHISDFLLYLKLNSDILARTILLTIVFLFFYGQSSLSGDTILAINVVLMQFLNWMSYGIDGFAFASESLVGKYKGAADSEKLNRAIRLSFWWGGAFAMLYSTLYFFGGELLMTLFTNDPEVIKSSRPFLIWMAVLPLIGFASYIWDGVYVGLTASVAMRNSMLISFVIFVLCYYLSGGVQESPHYLWLALLVFLGARGIIQTALYWSRGNRLT